MKQTSWIDKWGGIHNPDFVPNRRGTLVGENPGSDLATVAGLLAFAGTSVAASYVAAGMTHRTGDALFHGLNMVWAWGAWIYQTVNVNGFYVPGQHMNHLTAYGWSVVHAIEITWCVGVFVSLALYIGLNRLAAPKPDISGIKDSATMADPSDLYEAGFIAGD
jgi:hypothetical protein